VNCLIPRIYALLLILDTTSAFADGGTVLIAADREEFRITVFASPAPLRPGPIDVSVLVQQRTIGNAVADAMIEVLLQPTGPKQQSLRAVATNDAATNKLFRAALFDLPQAGPWRVSTLVTIGKRQFRVEADVEAAPALPHVSDLWLWTGWPAVAIGLFAAHRGLVNRTKRTRD
jgi:hypothetical protein